MNNVVGLTKKASIEKYIKNLKFIVGVPIRRYNPCIDPEQKQIPHIITTVHIKDGGVVGESFLPNVEHYPDHQHTIRSFIKTYLKE